jgi:hypothetical protein
MELTGGADETPIDGPALIGLLILPCTSSIVYQRCPPAFSRHAYALLDLSKTGSIVHFACYGMSI